MADEQKTSRSFKTTWFTRFARREHISDAALKQAVDEAEKGLVDANLGGNIIKQRIARPDQGKSGGYRTIIIFKKVSEHFLCMDLPKVFGTTYETMN